MTDEEHTKELRRLQKAVAQLTRQMQTLMADGERRREPSMRSEVRCPSCGGRRLIHAPSVLDRDNGGRNTMALVQPSIWRNKGLGEVEAIVCAGCGLLEWWVKDVEAVVHAIENDKAEGLRLIDAEDTGNTGRPYR